MIDGERALNEQAADALIVVLGGAIGMAHDGVRLMDLAPLLSAEPTDDLSGLRELARRMQPGFRFDAEAEAQGVRQGVIINNGRQLPPVASHGPEPMIDPAVARNFLLHSRRMVEEEDGSLRPTRLLRNGNKIDHIGQAALLIAQGYEPQLLSGVYQEITTNIEPFSNDVLQVIAHKMIDAYNGLVSPPHVLPEWLLPPDSQPEA